MLRRLMLVLLAVGSLSAEDQASAECHSADVHTLNQAGRDAMQKRQFDIAAQRFEAAHSACPARNEILLELGNAYFMWQHFPQAKETALQVLRFDPGNAAALEMKANSEYLEGDSGAAIGTFIDLLDRHPKNEDAAYMLGRIYYQEGRVDQAIGQFERVLQVNAYSYKAYDNLGLCYAARGDNDKATRYFLTAIKLVEKNHPEYDAAYADLAELLLKTGDNKKAFDAAAMAANRNPSSARDFYLGGKALELLGKRDLALNWLQRSAALDPNYPQPLYLLALIYHRLGDQEKFADARKKFLEAQAKVPSKRR
jgi:tetratricopeptide (TPR) repeat protein